MTARHPHCEVQNCVYPKCNCNDDVDKYWPSGWWVLPSLIGAMVICLVMALIFVLR